MMSKNVADIVVDTLKTAGARHCYGIPGDTLNHFTDALRRDGSIRWIHVRHEEVGGFAAGAEALMSDTLTLCAGSCGPGSLHFINGLYESHRNRAPVVLIASQIGRDQQNTEFPQEVDFLSVYEKCSVYRDQISSPEQAQRKAAMAAQAALTKDGVAILVLPADVASLPAPAHGGYAVHRSAPLTRPSEDELRHIADLLNDSKNVTIYGGSGCQGAHDSVVALAKALQAPVAHASRGKDFLEYSNPNNVGMMGIMGLESGCHAVAHCDTLLVLGADFAWAQFYPEKAKIIQIDIDSTHLGRRHPITVGAVGDVNTTVQALLPLIKPKQDHSFLDHCLDKHAVSLKSIGEHAAPTKSGMIRPQYLIRLIDQHAAADAMLSADGGSPMVWMLRYITANGQRRTLGSLLHGTMANAMPQAIGMQVAYPDRQVIALSGDGGLSMLMGDLLTLVQENVPIKIVVFNNSSLFFVEMEQKVEGLLDSYTDLKNPDFSQLAKVIGIWGKRVSQCDELEGAVQEWLAQPGPALLDVVVDKELVMPPSVGKEMVKGMTLYAAKAVLNGRSNDLLTLIKGNLSR